MKKGIIVCIAAFFFWGLVFHSNTIKTEASEEVKTTFTKQELLEDYDQLWEELRLYYPFFPVLEENGLDGEQLYQSGRQQIESRVSDVKGLRFVLDSIFRQMQNLAHLGVVSDTVISSVRHAYELAEKQGAEETQWLLPWVEILSDPQVEATYTQINEAGVTDVSESHIVPEVDISYLPDIKALYFHFKSFYIALEERDRYVMEDYLETIGDVPVEHVILDITGNVGGSTSYWRNNIVGVFEGDYTVDSFLFYKDHSLNRYFYREGLDYTLIADFPEDRTLPEFVKKLGLSHFTKVESTIGQNEGTVVGGLSDAKRWVLIDEQCYSASDAFAYFCKETDWATLVGKATSGDGAVGKNPAFLKLKNTGILVQFSSLLTANSDGTLNANRGTIPDILSKPGETPLDTCRRIIGAEDKK